MNKYLGYKNGDVVGELVFISNEPRKYGVTMGRFRCRCGKELVCETRNAVKLVTRSCGCMRYIFASTTNTRHTPPEYINNWIINMPHFTNEDIHRFWSRVKITANQNKCWEWVGSGNKEYGEFTMGKTGAFKSNRVAYYLYYNQDPKEMFVLHSCHNSRCCNPHHLSLGNNQQNMTDMVLAGRQHKGEQINTAKFTEKEVLEIRRMNDEGILDILEASKKRGVNKSTIEYIVNRKTWKHI